MPIEQSPACHPVGPDAVHGASGTVDARLVGSGAGVRCTWRDGVIRELTPIADAPADRWLAPTLFDPQVNGYAAVDFQREDVTAAELEHAMAALARDGCGAILLTLTTCPWDRLLAKLRARRAARAASPALTRAIAGWHIEGPFLSPEPGYRGAHDAALMSDPTPERMRELRAAAGDLPVLLTLAPERAGAIDAIREATALGIVVSIGHSNASADILRAAAAAGARAVTHLGNGIPQQLDRHDNLLWRVLDGPRFTVGLIPDAIHVSPQAFRLLHRLGVDAYYTTDAIVAAGSPPGRYLLGGVEFEVGADQVVRLPGSTNFAGSALAPLQGVLRAARMLGGSWRDAWMRAADVPRRLMGVRDPIAVGAAADFCLIDGGDTAIDRVQVVLGGAEVAVRERPTA